MLFSFRKLINDSKSAVPTWNIGIFATNDNYLCFQPTLLDSKNPGKYLTSPSSMADLTWVENQHGLNHTARSSKEAFFISTLTCSTKLTQNRK